MPRSPLAYLADIVEACNLIDLALRDLDLEAYRRDPIIRAAVERQFITIGEAVNTLSRLAPALADGISHVAMIVAFRNQLTHDYRSSTNGFVFHWFARPIVGSVADRTVLSAHGPDSHRSSTGSPNPPGGWVLSPRADLVSQGARDSW